MAIYTESTVAESYKKVCKKLGYLTMKCHPLSEIGIPDLITHTTDGETFYVETKTTGEECSPIQKEFHKRLKRRNIETYVLDTKVKTFEDLYKYGYTTYPGKHYKQL